jgi:2-polyprenyl-3-methyl-5-hydroxy-6-metoxy-1,4-benzoquinol methylase
MNEKFNYTCNICNSQEFINFLDVVDYTVSRETFKLMKCSSCHFLSTQFEANKPLSYYYESSEYISHTDSKKGVFNKLYQLVRNRTLNSKLRLVLAYGSLGKLLDYGCGTGHFLNHSITKEKVLGFGIEPSQSARQIATRNGAMVLADEEAFRSAVPRETFNAITLWHVLEHLPRLNESIAFIKSYMNNDSTLFIAVPNHESYDAKYYKEYWAAYDVPIHLYHFNPKSIVQLMDKHNFHLVEMKPMWFDAFYVSMLSEKYKSGKINYLKAFMIGLISNYKALLKPGTCSSQIYVFKLK